MTAKPSWLETAVFYEIYPQTYFDSNGDGIGDLPGITAKLEHIQSLGVNAIWLNPCFDSPFQDAGYDVRDYYKIAARYGTNEDARKLFEAAREKGIRILLDLVPGHTSIEHPWFQASCKYERNEYSDWYIWTDSGWTWEVPGLRLVNGYAERDATYVTNFFYCQPALNFGFANPDPRYPWQQAVDAPGPQRVRQELRNIMKFWLEMGCAGFRVDMAGSLVKNDPGNRATAGLWREMREWLDKEFPEAALVSEWSNPTTAIGGGFHMDFLLGFGSAGYQSLLRKTSPGGFASDPYGCSYFDASGRGNIQQFLDEYLRYYNETKGKGLICLITGNHDTTPRMADGRTTEDLEVAYLFLMTMPGAPYIYYGDEIGMRTVKGLPGKEGGLSRVGARTPMQWKPGPGAGFSTAKAEEFYLPIDPAENRPDVQTQEDNNHSILQKVRRMITLRKEHPALCASGDFEVVYAENRGYPFIYLRKSGDETLLVALNPANARVDITLPADLLHGEVETLYGLVAPFKRTPEGWRLQMPGVCGGVYRL